MNDEYVAFYEAVANKPFWNVPDGFVDKSTSITSFLCSDAARAIYEDAARAFTTFSPKYPDYKPLSGSEPAAEAAENFANMRSNIEALHAARRFVAYASQSGERGTPHKL